MEILIIIATLYLLAGMVSILGYMPTIKDLLNKKKSANIKSYLIWTMSSGITFTYALIAIPDILLRIVTGFTLIACATTLTLALRLEQSHKTI